MNVIHNARVALGVGLGLAALGVAACGSVKTADRGGEAREAVDPVLVQVIDGSPTTPVELVSLSVWDVDVQDELPAALPEDIVTSMRAAAGSLGAKSLFIEREDNPYRRAFYGLGAVPAPGATDLLPACSHDGFAERVQDARAATERCLRRLREDRPALRAEVTVVFQVDAWGGVMRAAPSLASSRDGLVRDCALEAVFDQDFGEPAALRCQGEMTATLGDAP
ncbi:MAG: hypothetical protein KC635_07590 [Myxococcales bacterium]|nr:hypothetical protein [Myxococcales bacterium]MCB9733351.1 hypothetical protein [Deltaproteobacteria bacterium]